MGKEAWNGLLVHLDQHGQKKTLQQVNVSDLKWKTTAEKRVHSHQKPETTLPKKLAEHWAPALAHQYRIRRECDKCIRNPWNPHRWHSAASSAVASLKAPKHKTCLCACQGRTMSSHIMIWSFSVAWTDFQSYFCWGLLSRSLHILFHSFTRQYFQSLQAWSAMSKMLRQLQQVEVRVTIAYINMCMGLHGYGSRPLKQGFDFILTLSDSG